MNHKHKKPKVRNHLVVPMMLRHRSGTTTIKHRTSERGGARNLQHKYMMEES